MSVVAEDRQGVYLLLDGRVGRPGPGQGAGLAKGRHVRASVQGDSLRVRWAAKEESWPLYTSRRAPAAPQGVGAAPGQVPYRAGQVWWRAGAGNTVKVEAAQEDGGMYTTGGGRYDAQGVNKAFAGNPDRQLTALLYDPALPAPRHSYAVGQVWQRVDGASTRVEAVGPHPDDPAYTARFADGWRRHDGGFSGPLGGSPRDVVRLLEQAPPSAVAAPPVAAPQAPPVRGKVPTGAPLKADGTVDWQVGQRWRLRNGEVVAVEVVDEEDSRYPVEIDGEWYTVSGWVNGSREDGEAGLEDDADVVAYVGPGGAVADSAAKQHSYAVGQRYRTRGGGAATITEVKGDALADNDYYYGPDGLVFGEDRHDAHDLMELLPPEQQGGSGLPTGAPLKPDGKVDWRVGQRWRLRNGDVAEVKDVEPSSYDGPLPVMLEEVNQKYSHWYGAGGQVRNESGGDPHDVVAYAGTQGEELLQPGKPLPLNIPYAVGQQFRTRGGAVVTVRELDGSTIPAQMQNGHWYRPDGREHSDNERSQDLVEFVAHPA